MLSETSFRNLLAACCVAWLLPVGAASAVDLQAFEFSDANGTELNTAANSVNPGNNWTTSLVLDNPAFSPSTVEAGSYRLVKETPGLATAHLQIANVASGSLYLVARMAGWAFRESDPPGAAEEVRFAFLNDDTGISGATITAEAVIRRNAAGTIELAGRALGIGGTTIAEVAPLATDQTAPFTLVLEANLDNDTYKVFYKNGTSPSQFLGLGAIAPTRDANSVRFAANNFFGDGNFAPVLFEEQVLVDRIAVSTTNPLSDFLTATVNRDTGALTLVNNTGVALPNLLSYSIESSAGSLNAAGWKTVAGNYDVNGNKTVDVDGAWSVQTATASTLAEGALDANGGALSVGQSVVLNLASGVWLKSPFEDLTLKLNFAGGVTRSADVSFTGNSGNRFVVGDLNFDGQVTAADWTTLITNAETSLAGLTLAQAYRRGDLDGDGVNSIFDVGLFQTAYDAANGPGAFAVMAASVPEPSGVLAALLAVAAGCVLRLPRRASAWACLALLLAAPTPGRAAILDDFPFTDANGARLGEVENVANPAHVWLEETSVMTESFVNGGVLRVQKANDDFARNILDINNITSGKAWLVAQFAGWSFSSLVGPAEFDDTQLEEIRLNFLDNDTGLTNASSTVTAQAMISRTPTGGLELTGSALGGGTPIAATPLSLTQSQAFQLVLELDNDANTYTLYTKNGAAPFASAGTGNISSARNGNSVRFGVNNNFGGTGEFLDVDRIYITDVSPIVDAVDPLTLRVNTTTGAVSIVNASSVPYAFDSYRIESASGSLRVGDAFWSSLSDRAVDAVDGPDAGSTLGDGVGETWDEAGGSGPGVLAESFLLGSTSLAPTQSLALGSPVTPGGTPLIDFQFRRADTGAVISGLVEFVTGGLTGDYNGDGAVNAADYTVWRDTLNQSVPAGTGADGDSNGVVGPADYTVWKNSFGLGAAVAAVEGSPVPEPAAVLLLLVAAGFPAASRAWRPRGRVATAAPFE
ncbi:hypothetical protein Pla175_25380 [Pirellulimonas nuda]|uniref:PEP-CTERM protein-sorting domain-containing protein n=1 Tax=Pirellulimonas nuda TaxID=2528009 RepID=A0A518DCD8_9BACT|nr:hypothetical protein [Pirellulimonas nuda]QDU89151.1 hypothetical protein Pla175_25380 [Pirellulimonas nuda]